MYTVVRKGLGLKKMYKTILLTDQEILLLGNILSHYISNNQHNKSAQVLNAHILFQHLDGRQTHKSTQSTYQ